MGKYIIGIDQSTQGTKALLVDEGGHLIHRCDRAHRQIVSDEGWVSHDSAEIAENVLAVARAVVEETGVDPAEIVGVGISNQRETTVAWDARTGAPVCDAVVWQCARAQGGAGALAVLSRIEDGMDHPECPRGPPSGGARRPSSGDHRRVGCLDAHRWTGVPLRLLQREPHAAVQPP